MPRSWKLLLIICIGMMSIGLHSCSEKQSIAEKPVSENTGLDVKAVSYDDVKQTLSTVSFPSYQSSSSKLLILGLDGITPVFFNEYIASGKMPVLESLLKTSAYGVLRSSVIPSSAVAWTSSFTGQTSIRHGMTSFFVVQENGNLGLISAAYRKKKAIWELLTESNRSATVINVPGTYPPDPVNGVFVSCLLSPPGSIFTKPPELTDKLHQLSYYTTTKPLQQSMRPGSNPFDPLQSTGTTDDLFTITFNQAKIAIYLYKQLQSDLFFNVFTIPDRLQHARHIIPGELLSNAYENLDRIVGEFLKAKPDDTPLMIFSDHGFKPYEKAFAVNYWLQQSGLIAFRDGQIQMTDTRVYMIDSVGNYFTLRINLKDRDIQGIVQPDSYPALVSLITKSLESLQDGNGATLVKSVIVSSADTENFSAYMADIIVELDPAFMATGSLEPTALTVSLKPPVFDHERDGFYLINGHGIKSMQLNADIQDMMPTALYLLNQPIPKNIDGRFLEELITPDYLQQQQPRYSSIDMDRKRTIKERSKDEDRAIVEYLESLGYVK